MFLLYSPFWSYVCIGEHEVLKLILCSNFTAIQSGSVLWIIGWEIFSTAILCSKALSQTSKASLILDTLMGEVMGMYVVDANSRMQILWFLLASGKEGGLKECETSECDGGSDRELSASPTTKQKGCKMMGGEARVVCLEQSQLAVGAALKIHEGSPQEGGSWPWRAIRIYGAVGKAEENAASMSSQPQATERAGKLTPGSQSQLCCSLSPRSCLSTAAATASFNPCCWGALSPCWDALALYNPPCAPFFLLAACLFCLVVILFQSCEWFWESVKRVPNNNQVLHPLRG